MLWAIVIVLILIIVLEMDLCTYERFSLSKKPVEIEWSHQEASPLHNLDYITPRFLV